MLFQLLPAYWLVKLWCWNKYKRQFHCVDIIGIRHLYLNIPTRKWELCSFLHGSQTLISVLRGTVTLHNSNCWGLDASQRYVNPGVWENSYIIFWVLVFQKKYLNNLLREFGVCEYFFFSHAVPNKGCSIMLCNILWHPIFQLFWSGVHTQKKIGLWGFLEKTGGLLKNQMGF